MKHNRTLLFASLFGILAVLSSCIIVDSDGGSNDRDNGRNLNEPGSWAYQKCQHELQKEIEQRHSHVGDGRIDGYVYQSNETGRYRTLSGEAKFPRKDGDNVHVSFRCVVDLNNKKVDSINFEKK